MLCLLLGIVVGYLLRRSGPAPVAASPMQAQPAESMPGGMPQVTPEQLKHMADKQAEPILSQLQAKPNDPALLAQAGNVYYDAQQYKQAVDYYSRALDGDPNNTNVRTDLGTAYWYVGDSDHAIAEFDRVLRQEPTKGNALFNRGVVKWQGKMDIKGAVADWEALLKADPNYRERAKVEEMLAQAKKHLNIKPGEKTSQPAM
jgi:tetratricopeptide (TPR) repeat protein